MQKSVLNAAVMMIFGGLVAPVTAVPSMQQLGAKASASSAGTRFEASKAIDGDTRTFWHSALAGAARHPHWLQVEFDSPTTIGGFSVLPRQDGQRNGWICDFALYASSDGRNWGQPVNRGTFKATPDLKTIRLETPVTGRFFLLAALSGFAGAPAAVAEFALIPADRSGGDGAPRPARRHVVEIDGAGPGRIFDGVGGISAGGSSRLLIDYPEPERSQILDYLFRPNYGAALQILKVEIGADTDTTAGAEPSHMRKADKIESDLGYEWWLMQEAKARNPALKLCALAWGGPGWLNGGFWSDDNIRYTLAWLDCAKQRGFHLDYLGGGNERGFDAAYYVRLREALNLHGYGDIKLIASDDHNPPNYWEAAKRMTTDRAFAAAVDILGSHDFCVWRTQQRHCYVSEAARSLGKPIWDSENSTQDYKTGFEPLARAMNRHYIEGGVTGNLNWSLVGAYYGSLSAPGTGLLLADRPWSGWYDVGKSVWVDAHTTQFTAPGWRYVDSGCGYTTGGASYVTLRSPERDAYTIVIETLDSGASETLDLRIAGGLPGGPVQLWTTDLRSDREADYFIHARTIMPAAGRYDVSLSPGHLYTLSTTTGQQKGKGRSRAAASQRMPLPYAEDFESTGKDRLAAYLSDVHGGFQAVPAGGGRSGMAYRQMVAQEPTGWHNRKMPPTTVVGDPLWPGDYEVAVDALLEGPGYVELLGRLEDLSRVMSGYHFQIAESGAWTLYTQDARARDLPLASGHAGLFGVNTWHRLALHFRGSEIMVTLDGRELARVRDDAHAGGQVGLRVNAWQHAQFDNLRVTATTPARKFVPHEEMKATATSEHAENDFGSVYLARHAIDDRVETSWRSEYLPPLPLPQSLTLDLGRVRTIGGLVYYPPANPANGAITRYTVGVSTDGKSFKEVAAGKWKPAPSAQTTTWTGRPARFVRLEALAAEGGAGASVREIEVIEK